MRPDNVLLSAYLDGEVPEQYRAEMAAFIDSDPLCNARFEQLKQLRVTLHSQDTPELETRMARGLESINRRVAVTSLSRTGLRWRQIRVPVPALAAAAFVVVTLAAVLVWSFLPKAPASAPDYLAQGQDVDVTIRVDNADMEHVLQWLADKEMLGEISIQLPEQQFQIVGEPVLLKPATLAAATPYADELQNAAEIEGPEGSVE
jgi:anti-sigma factor RsiW